MCATMRATSPISSSSNSGILSATARRWSAKWPIRPTSPPGSTGSSIHHPWRVALEVLGWLASIAFCLWAARLLVLEGYLYVAAEQFTNGDFPRTANLGSPEFWSGQGIFYGPIFVLEWRYLLAPGLVPYAEFARLNFVLL